MERPLTVGSCSQLIERIWARLALAITLSTDL
jgi:hypothetical protein